MKACSFTAILLTITQNVTYSINYIQNQSMQKKDISSISHSYIDYSCAIKSEKYNTTVMLYKCISACDKRRKQNHLSILFFLEEIMK